MHAGSAKAAIDAMTRHLAVEWGPSGIRINGIAPGPIEGTVGMRKLGELYLCIRACELLLYGYGVITIGGELLLI